MTIRELIEKLEPFDPNRDITIDISGYREIDTFLESIECGSIFHLDKIYEGSDWNINITIKQ